MRRVLILAIVLAMLGVALPAAAAPDKPNDRAWTELDEGHYVNNAVTIIEPAPGVRAPVPKGKAFVIKIYHEGDFSGTETINGGPNAANLETVPCPKDGTDDNTWWTGGPLPDGIFFACHHFDFSPE